ncbi:hypothetical protein BM1_09310 [Bipolaris maydis]|nr:hypothetical protein BM1_09310 [Bipolaris maydis]
MPEAPYLMRLNGDVVPECTTASFSVSRTCDKGRLAEAQSSLGIEIGPYESKAPDDSPPGLPHNTSP